MIEVTNGLHLNSPLLAMKDFFKYMTLAVIAQGLISQPQTEYLDATGATSLLQTQVKNKSRCKMRTEYFPLFTFLVFCIFQITFLLTDFVRFNSSTLRQKLEIQSVSSSKAVFVWK